MGAHNGFWAIIPYISNDKYRESIAVRAMLSDGFFVVLTFV